MREFKDLLQQIMDERKLKATDVSELTGIGNGAISMYLSGRRTPKQSTIVRFAQGLNVSEEWLLGYDVPKERLPESARIARSMSLESKMSEEMLDHIVKFYYQSSFSKRVDIFQAVRELEFQDKE